jgi:hypothetical protein
MNSLPSVALCFQRAEQRGKRAGCAPDEVVLGDISPNLRRALRDGTKAATQHCITADAPPNRDTRVGKERQEEMATKAGSQVWNGDIPATRTVGPASHSRGSSGPMTRGRDLPGSNERIAETTKTTRIAGECSIPSLGDQK